MNTCRTLRIPTNEKSDGSKQYIDYLVSGGDEKVIRMFEPSLSFINSINKIGEVNMRLFFENKEDEEKFIDPSSKDRVQYRVNLEAT